MFLQSVHNKKRRGFSLTEFAIVLGILGIVVGALWGVVSVVHENMKRTQMKEQLYVAVAKTRDHFLSFPCATINMSTCTGGVDLTESLFRANALPYEMLDKTGGTWVGLTPWGTDFAVKSGDAGANNSDRFFTVELSGLERDTCLGLSSKLTGTGNATGLAAFQVNGAPSDIPASPETAACAAGSGNDLVLVYTLRAE